MKQERLEEAAEILYPVNNTGSMFMANRDELNNSLKQEGFIKVAKWQAERMYTEEDVLKLWNWLNDGFIIRKSLPTREELIGWFEQFKNK